MKEALNWIALSSFVRKPEAPYVGLCYYDRVFQKVLLNSQHI
jgi:hypothetical protein